MVTPLAIPCSCTKEKPPALSVREYLLVGILVQNNVLKLRLAYGTACNCSLR
ncbi:MAG: hypothetical protein BWX52_01370 [Bacteroidetes bacterium ADurb.Bin013]|nr:MAG: hypothetical protein BWX52_01370 [Bacteroidetes bacterium ADurb.Bin013]